MHARRRFILLAPGTLIAAAIVAAMLLLPRSAPAEAGAFRTCALAATGAVECRGDDSHGAPAGGSRTASTTPANVSGLSRGMATVSLDGDRSCALSKKRGVECRRLDAAGRVGAVVPSSCMTPFCANTPLDVAGLTSGVGQITAGAGAGLGGSINGTVTDEDTGAPLSDICITVFDAEPLSNFFAEGLTDGDGSYSVGGLAAGDYLVAFDDCRSPRTYVFEFYDDKPDFASADLVAVIAESKTPGIDAALKVGGSINGTVTDAGTDAPLPGICVEINDAAFTFGIFDSTDANGSYSVGGLPAGDYKVSFFDCGDGSTYLTEWYDDKPDFDSADLVAVIAPSKTSGINAALARLAVFGDVSCDSIVDAVDPLLILQLVAGLVQSLACESSADVDLNGLIDPLDALIILQFIAGLVDSLPP